VISGPVPPTAADHAARHSRSGAGRGYPLRVELLDFLHYGLVALVALAAIATIWFAAYVVYRLHND
jgi:hypothetical protein